MNCRGMYRLKRAGEVVVYHCGAETTNGLALCDLCQRQARAHLEYLPIYFRNLARWRPGGTGRSVPGSREPRLVGTAADRVSRATDEAGNMLTTWARTLTDDRGGMPAKLLDRLNAADLSEGQVIAWLCRGFEKYLTSVATLEWCGEFVADVAEHGELLLKLTMEAVPGWYAGGCRHCGADTYVVPGLTWVTCGACGTTTFARDHVDTVLEEARGWTARPRSLAAAAVALIDTEQSVERLYERIKKWGQRNHLTPVRRLDEDGDEVGPKAYRFGEVLDRLATDGATHTDAAVPRAC